VATEKEVMDALRGIIDINGGKNIVEEGLVSGVEINEDEKRIYVMFRPHGNEAMMRFFETRIRDIIQNMGYDPEVEVFRQNL
jgi:metal-sulfur cluster biosynthetic enzyme